uniref:DUF2182 domain-containing protein n=1 Tax=Macrostomum lignano TaxID=282301 RepID=A0A1I8FJ93_9PLAT
MSAGNTTARSFAAVAARLGAFTRWCLMPPISAPPAAGVDHIRSQGVLVETCPSSELQSRVDATPGGGQRRLPVPAAPFDDRPLIAGPRAVWVSNCWNSCLRLTLFYLAAGWAAASQLGLPAALALSSKSRLHEKWPLG